MQKKSNYSGCTDNLEVNQVNHVPTIIARFLRYVDVEYILRNAKNLKNTNYTISQKGSSNDERDR